MLGVHIRGTDKYLRPQIEPPQYFAMIDAFLDHAKATNGSAQPLIFLATDDKRAVETMRDRYGTRLRMQPGVLRGTGKQAIWKDIDAARAQRKGDEVLLDSLLLSKCDFLLKSMSAVSEFALYFRPALHQNSYDLNMRPYDQPTPSWYITWLQTQRDVKWSPFLRSAPGEELAAPDDR